jgi:hydroxymethylbilane synthase
VSEVLEPERMLPAPGQGALAVECRAGDGALAAFLRAALENAAARVAVTAERSLLRALEAGCTAPVGALAELSGGQVRLRAVAADVEGRTAVHGVLSAAAGEATDLGRRLADQMLADGAAGLFAPIPGSTPGPTLGPTPGPTPGLAR